MEITRAWLQLVEMCPPARFFSDSSYSVRAAAASWISQITSAAFLALDVRPFILLALGL